MHIVAPAVHQTHYRIWMDIDDPKSSTMMMILLLPTCIPYLLECNPMGVKVLPQKRTVIIMTVLFWGNTFTPMGLHSSGYGNPNSVLKKVLIKTAS